MNERGACRCELVWNAGRTGTGEAPSGATVEVSEMGDWTPGRMLSLAAQSSLLFQFLRLAEECGLEVLGYVSSGGSPSGAPKGGLAESWVLSPCVVVETEEDAARAGDLLERALAASNVCRLLPGTVELDPRLVVAMRVLA